MSADRRPGAPITRRAALAVAGGLLANGLVDAAVRPIERGEPVVWPPLTLLGGQLLSADAWKDTAAVIVFWATWCPYCRRHNARIDKLHRAFASEHLRVLGVALDGDEAAVRRYLSVNGYSFPVVAGDAALRGRFSARQVIPMTVLVNRRGLFVEAIPGEMAEDDVLALSSLANDAQGPTT